MNSKELSEQLVHYCVEYGVNPYSKDGKQEPEESPIYRLEVALGEPYKMNVLSNGKTSELSFPNAIRLTYHKNSNYIYTFSGDKNIPIHEQLILSPPYLGEIIEFNIKGYYNLFSWLHEGKMLSEQRTLTEPTIKEIQQMYDSIKTDLLEILTENIG